jgi:hypothetical protein
MMSDTSKLLATAALVATTGLAGANPARPDEKPALTIDTARTLILRANRAADDWTVAGLTNSFNPNSSVTIDNRQVALGLTPESCTRLKESSRFLVDLDTYKAAQDLLVQSGNLPKEKAERQYKIQSEMMDVFYASANNIIDSCKAHGVTNFEFAPTISRALGLTR